MIMPDAPWLDAYLATTVFLLGACWGSFLNVCIYRIQRGESVVAPRSHCTTCNYMIAWYDNVPLLSWLLLRARCRKCGEKISPRYFLVELLTAALFLAVWLQYGLDVRTPIYWLVTFGLLLGTFIDIDQQILPDRCTIGGMILGVGLSAAFPVLHGEATWKQGLVHSAIGLLLGFGSLFFVVEVGKKLFGRKRCALERPETLAFDFQHDEPAAMKLGDDVMPWGDLFYRRSDQWAFECDTLSMGDRVWTNTLITVDRYGVTIGTETHPHAALQRLAAQVNAYTFPREAMGFGDVKLMGAIGAFFGAASVAFTIMMSAFVGSLVGGAMILFGRADRGTPIPYGPFIAAAALAWMLGAHRLWEHYLHWFVQLSSP